MIKCGNCSMETFVYLRTKHGVEGRLKKILYRSQTRRQCLMP